jgi:hypothetical protein
MAVLHLKSAKLGNPLTGKIRELTRIDEGNIMEALHFNFIVLPLGILAVILAC